MAQNTYFLIALIALFLYLGFSVKGCCQLGNLKHPPRFMGHPVDFKAPGGRTGAWIFISIGVVFALIMFGSLIAAAQQYRAERERLISQISQPSVRQQVKALSRQCVKKDEDYKMGEIRELVKGVRALEKKEGTLIFAGCRAALVSEPGVSASIAKRVEQSVQTACLSSKGERGPYQIDKRVKLGEKSSLLLVRCS